MIAAALLTLLYLVSPAATSMCYATTDDSALLDDQIEGSQE